MIWEMEKLGGVCEVIAGQSPESTYYNKDGNGSPFFQGKADFNEDYPTVRYYTTKITKTAKVDDILLSVRAPVGPTNICNVEACIGRGLASIRVKERLFYKFVYFHFKSIEAKLSLTGNGSTFSAITTGDVKNITIPVPPLSTQKHIAQILDKADALRKKDQQLLKCYDDLAQSLFIDMFGDPVKNSFKWKTSKIGDISNSKLGKMLDEKKFTGEQLCKYLGNSNVLWHDFNLNDLKEMEFSEAEKQKYQMLYGDIIMCEGGDVGRCAIWKSNLSNVYFQKALHRIRLNTDIVIQEYFVWLMYFLKTNNGLKNFITSATISHLTGEKLKSIEIPIPPISLQNQFAAQIQNIEQQKEKVKTQIQASENLFRVLLQQAFNGGLN